MSGPVTIRGGAGGLAVALDDLGRAAGVLVSEAVGVAEEGARLALALPGPEIVLATGARMLAARAARHPEAALLPADPGGLAAVVAEVARTEAVAARALGPGGAAGQATALAGLAAAVRGAAAAYRAGEAGAGALVSAAQDLVMGQLGRLVLPAVPALLAGGAALAVDSRLHTGLTPALTRELDTASRRPPVARRRRRGRSRRSRRRCGDGSAARLGPRGGLRGRGPTLPAPR